MAIPNIQPPPNTQPIGWSPNSFGAAVAGSSAASAASIVNNLGVFNGVVPLIVASIELTQAQVQAWQASGGYTVVPAPPVSTPNIQWNVVRWFWDRNIKAAYTINLTLTLVYTDGSPSGMGTIASGLATNSRVTVSGAQNSASIGDVRGLGLKVTANGNPAGGNAGDKPRLIVHYTPMLLSNNA
jgi:hypothetical protein